MAARLREVRHAFGDMERDAFAAKLNISANSVARYERGDRVPDGDVLAAYKSRFGISADWLLTGEGEMFTDPSKAPVPSKSVNVKLMHKLARLAREVHSEIGSKPHGDAVTEDAAELYNELLLLVSSMDDGEEIEATLPRLRLLFKRKLQEHSRNREEGRNTA